jgi:hypothetical protein
MSNLREMAGQDATAAGVVAVDTDDIVVPHRFGWWNDIPARQAIRRIMGQ